MKEGYAFRLIFITKYFAFRLEETTNVLTGGDNIHREELRCVPSVTEIKPEGICLRNERSMTASMLKKMY